MTDGKKPAKEKMGAYLPPAWEVADASALQALANGTADDVQQQRAIKWLIELAAGTYEFHYYPSDRDTAFALGRAFVGQQIVKLLKINTSQMRRL